MHNRPERGSGKKMRGLFALALPLNLLRFSIDVTPCRAAAIEACGAKKWASASAVPKVRRFGGKKPPSLLLPFVARHSAAAQGSGQGCRWYVSVGPVPKPSPAWRGST